MREEPLSAHGYSLCIRNDIEFAKIPAAAGDQGATLKLRPVPLVLFWLWASSATPSTSALCLYSTQEAGPERLV